ncbi:MAG: methionyl-tRNA formyltransferase [Coriobacteriia bacterium]|nr:methionyl-tRNA formyltransferase [Coriobacteriia bacterium]
MRIVFMGTPAFAATILEYLAEQHEVVAVYTRPDAVRGRGAQLVPSPVKRLAESLGLPVHTPSTLKDAAVQQQMAAYEPDVICVAAYGMLLPPQVLDIPPLGCVNAHASVLPRWRGAAPVERAILAGDAETGVCVMRMEEGLDTGDWLVRRTMPVEDRTAAELTDELATLGAQALLTGLSLLESGRAQWNPQGDEGVVYAEKIGKRELFLAPDDGAVAALRKVRASGDAHPCKCVLAGKKCTVLEAREAPAECAVAPGALALTQKRLVMGFADGALQVCQVKPDGKNAMAGAAFAAGVQGIKAAGAAWGALDE